VTDSEFWTGPLDYRLPPELIAQQPARHRRDSRLLILDVGKGEIRHGRFPDIADNLVAGDVLVANDSRVFPARLFANKRSGGRVELLILNLHENPAPAMSRSSKALREGQELVLADGTEIRVEGPATGGRCRIRFPEGSVRSLVERLGSVPLPPYIDRADSQELAGDIERYQTVYADESGSVAAPTAGLHFDRDMLDGLAAKGVDFETVTLHVGPGTFTPIRSSPERHRMEAEYCRVTPTLVSRLRRARAEGARTIAVGTTTVRALETAASSGHLNAFEGSTAMFIRPGYRFGAVDALLTNFHLPQSTLLCLVMALAGEDLVRRAYREAVEQSYRFYSFGDAMLIL
jgi:S-adenosylmethionine:tRNA ribosyltransferase-isomerase